MRVNASGGHSTIEVNVDNLPATDVRKGSRGLGIFLTIFGLVWGGIPTVGTIASILSGNFKPEMLMVLIFTAIGTALVLGGINQFFSVKTTTISRSEISYHKKNLFGTKQWTEKMTAYKGVLSREEYHSGGKNQSSYTLYIVELIHADDAKKIRLYESRSCPDLRARWENYARALDMPALEKDGSGYVERNVEDLDKSVRELAQENKLQVDFDPTRPPPKGLQLKVEGEVLAVSVKKKSGGFIGALIAILLPGAFIYCGFFIDDCPVMFGVVGTVIAVVMGAVIVFGLISSQQVLVGKDSVETCWMTPWGRKFSTTFNSSAIESVKIDQPRGQGQQAVIIATDQATGKIGQGLSADSLEWLKQCILAVITK